MSESSDKSILVAKVVDVLYGEMLSRPMRVKEDWPDQIKEKALQSQKIFQENYRIWSTELYEQHMTIKQLQALLDFQTSDIGKSIKEAQAKIEKELMKKSMELEAERNKSKPSGLAVIRTRTFIDDDDQDS